MAEKKFDESSIDMAEEMRESLVNEIDGRLELNRILGENIDYAEEVSNQRKTTDMIMKKLNKIL